jgi:hypothetical protein
MPGRAKPGPSVKDDKVYEAIRDEGASKEKAARIANAGAARGRSNVGRKGGKAGSYDEWLGLSGYSGKRKAELVSMLRNH